MNKETITQEMLDLITQASQKANLLAIMTGDNEFSALSTFLRLGPTAKAKGDLIDFMELISQAMEEKISAASGVDPNLVIINKYPMSAN
jgi:hypothetical protein